MNKILPSIAIQVLEPIIIHCDNTSIVSMLINPMLHSKTIKKDDLDSEIIEEKSLVTQVEKKSDWIIDSGCSHHMTSDMTKFIKFRNHDGGIVRVGNNVTCHIIGTRSITLDSKTNIDDVHIVDGLKHNLLSVGKLVDKEYLL